MDTAGVHIRENRLPEEEKKEHNGGKDIFKVNTLKTYYLIGIGILSHLNLILFGG